MAHLFQNERVFAKISKRENAQKGLDCMRRRTRKALIDDDDEVTFSIGGQIYTTRKSTLRNVPDTKLSRLDENSAQYNTLHGVYFFDRNPFMFEYILGFYRTGNMHIPRNLCSSLIREELLFWELGDGCISECCGKLYFDELSDKATYEKIKDDFNSLPTYNANATDFSLSRESVLKEFKQRAWVFIENAESSKLSTVGYIYRRVALVLSNKNFLSTNDS